MGDHYPKKIIKYIHTKEKSMKIAVVGSQNLKIENLGDYLPAGTTEIVSGGARNRHLRERIRQGSRSEADGISPRL